MRGATDSCEMILNGNVTAPLFENFLQGKCNGPSPPPFGGAPSPKGKARTAAEIKPPTDGSLERCKGYGPQKKEAGDKER